MIRPHTKSFSFRTAFTLIEMMVATGILVILILSIGVIFQSASKAVGVSQASMEMLSGVRSFQRQLESDLSGIDKDGFLVIRSSTFLDTSVVPNVTRRSDQISFMSYGAFPNKTGSDNVASGLFTDNSTIAPAAFIWWGQLAFERGNPAASPLSPSTYLPTTPTYKIPLNQVPNGFLHSATLADGDFALGRYTMALVPNSAAAGTYSAPAGSLAVPGFTGDLSATPPIAAIDYNNTTQGTAPESAFDVTQSRISVARMTPQQIMSALIQDVSTTPHTRTNPITNQRFEADHFCYRHGVLTSPYDSFSGTLVEGYFRMHPVALQGISSIAIDWTDGSVYAATDVDIANGDPANNYQVNASLVGTTRWYGQRPDSKSFVKVGNAVATENATYVDNGSTGALVSASNGDNYTAIFSYDNRAQWPVALRFRYHVADLSGRLTNGRDFVQVIKLP